MSGWEKIDPKSLSDVLRYEPDTGKLYWLVRPAEMFPAGNTGSVAMAKTWNTRFAGKEAFTSLTDYGHRYGRLFGRCIRAHRAAWALHYGVWPSNVIDHINRNPVDNRIVNLRDVSQRINARNAANRKNKSGVMGVYPARRKGAWYAQVTDLSGKTVCLGTFETKEQASAERAIAASRYGYLDIESQS